MERLLRQRTKTALLLMIRLQSPKTLLEMLSRSLQTQVLGDGHPVKALQLRRVVLMIFREVPGVVEEEAEGVVVDDTTMRDAEEDKTTMRVAEGDKTQTADPQLRPLRLPRHLQLNQKLQLWRKLAGALSLSQRRIAVVAAKPHAPLPLKY